MTLQDSDNPAASLIETFVRHNEMRMDAVRTLDVPTTNRHFLRASKAAEALSATTEGRAALESLLTHPTLYIRVSAAACVLHWSAAKAIPQLGRALEADLSAIASADERLDIRDNAMQLLYDHFGIRSFDRNDLIVPLKAYGIDLPRVDHAAWQ